MNCGKAAAKTSEIEGGVTRGTDPVLCLPVATAFDAKADAQGVVHSAAKEFFRMRRLSGRFTHRAAEDQLELRAGGPELGSGSEGEIELEAAGQQEHPIDRRSAWEIK